MSNEAQQHESQHFIIGDLVTCYTYRLPPQNYLEWEKSCKTIYVYLGINIKEYSSVNLLSQEGIVIVVPHRHCTNLSK